MTRPAKPMEPHQRPSYRLASFARSGFAATRAMASSPASSSLATVLSEGALARGLLRPSTIPQPDATNYPPARPEPGRHHIGAPGDFVGIRARSVLRSTQPSPVLGGLVLAERDPAQPHLAGGAAASMSASAQAPIFWQGIQSRISGAMRGSRSMRTPRLVVGP